MTCKSETIIIALCYLCIFVLSPPLAWLLHYELYVPKSITLLMLVVLYIAANIYMTCMCNPHNDPETQESIPLEERELL